ncbi:DUF7848 domain-containing protein [Streptomyces iakyrus]
MSRNALHVAGALGTTRVLRFVPHTIRQAPEGGITAQHFCVAYGCTATSGPLDDPGKAQDWALRHTGQTGHDLFRREFTDHARVTRDGDEPEAGNAP